MRRISGDVEFRGKNDVVIANIGCFYVFDGFDEIGLCRGEIILFVMIGVFVGGGYDYEYGQNDSENHESAVCVGFFFGAD